MDIMVVGGGGREHALIQALRRSKKVERIYALPGNGGLMGEAECVDIAATDLEAITAFAAEKRPDLTVVAPDDPLVMGLVDRLHALGLACFGPEAAAARIEGSKSFAKELMASRHIPTAAYRLFTSAEEARAYLDTVTYPVVLKADGLALGKGVTIAADRQEAEQAIRLAMEEKVFGDSGSKLLIEEFLSGPEVSVLTFTDGKTVVPLVSAMDHKRALEHDLGPNTGGMGAIAPNPYYTPDIARRCMEEIFQPTVDALAAAGCPFRGCLYFGLMLTADGPRVIEYNCRFGDPEAQAVLPLLDSDLVEIMLAAEQGTLRPELVRFRPGASCCVVIASAGYPVAYRQGFPIRERIGRDDPTLLVCYAGCRRQGEELVTAGGRVLSVTAVAEDLPTAIRRAYLAAALVEFSGSTYRRDIGQRALAALAERETTAAGCGGCPGCGTGNSPCGGKPGKERE